jgi:hypothetical protein
MVHLRTTISYKARGYFKPRIGPTLSAGCGNDEHQPQILIELVTPLTLTRNWHLRSAAKLDLLAPASDAPQDRCIVSILKYDVTDKVRRGSAGDHHALAGHRQKDRADRLTRAPRAGGIAQSADSAGRRRGSCFSPASFDPATSPNGAYLTVQADWMPSQDRHRPEPKQFAPLSRVGEGHDGPGSTSRSMGSWISARRQRR